jgi:hypothetical protein
LLLIRQFFAWLTGPLTSKCTLTFAHSFAKLSRKYHEIPFIPSHQHGGHQKKSKHHFWKLGCCIWSLFLGTSESNVRQYQRQVQGCASRSWYLIWLWRSLTFGSLAATYEGKSKCAVPFCCRTPGRQEVVALHKL